MSESLDTMQTQASSSLRRWLGRAAIAALFVVAFLLGSGRVNVAIRLNDAPSSRALSSQTTQRAPGEQLVLVYIGSSTCKPSNITELPGIVESTKRSVGREAQKRGSNLVTVGLSKDASVDRGLAHLRKFGSFDEVATGNGWLNTTTMKYVAEDFPGLPGTPQVVLTRRTVRAVGAHEEIAQERLLVRKVGLTEIKAWLSAGTPVPVAIADERPSDSETGVGRAR